MINEDDIEQMSDIELSSDSEPEPENEDGVSLVVFKRPQLRVRTFARLGLLYQTRLRLHSRIDFL